MTTMDFFFITVFIVFLGSMNPQSSRAANEDQSRHFNTANGLGGNASENLHGSSISDKDCPVLYKKYSFLVVFKIIVRGQQFYFSL